MEFWDSPRGNCIKSGKAGNYGMKELSWEGRKSHSRSIDTFEYREDASFLKQDLRSCPH